MHKLAKRLMLLAAVVGSTGLFASVGLGQQNEPPAVVEQRNPYIYAKLGVGGKSAGDQPVTGRWAIGTVAGNPELPDDDNQQLIYNGFAAPAGHFGYTSVRIDDKTTIFGNDGDGAWQYPAPYQRGSADIVSSWQHTASKVSIRLVVTVVRDVARFEYTIKNNDLTGTADPDNPGQTTGPKAHTIGLRFLGNTTVDAQPNDAGTGNVIAYPYVPGYGFLTYETDLTGGQIPAWFDIYNDKVNPTTAVRNILREQDATIPDRVALGEWGNLISDDWNYNPVAGKAVKDWAWAVWYNPVSLAPGAEMKVVAYYGVSAASASWTTGIGSYRDMDRYCLAVQSPVALKYDATKTPQLSGTGGDNKFEIKAYVYNLFKDRVDLGDVILKNVTVNLWLPEGLKLASGSESIQISDIAPGTESQPVKWTVYATGDVCGKLTYKVLATGSPGFTQQVSRSIIVPATLSSSAVKGWQLLSMPFEFKNTAWDNALQFNPGVRVLNASDWQSAGQQYSPLVSLEPGKGFWLQTQDSASLTMVGEPTALSGVEDYNISLREGWNLIGNPYVYPIDWGRVSLIVGSKKEPIETAAQKGYIRQSIYWWDTNMQAYDYASDRMTSLLPFAGYWVKALTDCQLVIPPIDQIGASVSNSAVTSNALRSRARAIETVALPGTKDNWKLRVVAKAGSATDNHSICGVDTRSADGYDLSDVERPPSVQNYVAVTFPHRDWGINSGAFLKDIRRSAGVGQSWDMEVSTDQKNTDVVLTWPELVNVPKDVVLKLVDVDANVTKHMRTTSSYRFNSGTATTRRFKIVTQPAGVGRLMITGLNVGKSKALGGVTVSYALSSEASTDVRIKTSLGKTVRNLTVGRGTTRGIASMSWNFRSESGEPVAAGSYMVEVIATTPDGEVAKAIRPFIVGR